MGRNGANLAALVALGCLSFGCSRSQPEGDLFEREIGIINDWLSAGEVRSVSSPQRSDTKWRKSVSWRAESDLAWEKVVERLQPRSPIGYDHCQARGQDLVCTRQLVGDTFHLTVHAASPSPRLTLDVTMSAEAS